MKPFLFASSAAALLCSSCITAAVTAATGAAGTMGGATGMSALGLSHLLSNGAPEDMEGHTITCADAATGTAVALAFPKGVESNLQYHRTADKTATVTCASAEGQELYRLTFTSAEAGTYVQESTDAAGTKSLSHGSFSVK